MCWHGSPLGVGWSASARRANVKFIRLPRRLIFSLSAQPWGFFPSLAVQLGVPEPDRRFLGRWTPRHSVDDYVRDSRDKVLRIIQMICFRVNRGWRPDESLTVERIFELSGHTWDLEEFVFTPLGSRFEPSAPPPDLDKEPALEPVVSESEAEASQPAAGSQPVGLHGGQWAEEFASDGLLGRSSTSGSAGSGVGPKDGVRLCPSSSRPLQTPPPRFMP